MKCSRPSQRNKSFLTKLCQQKASYLFIAPALILFTVFVIVPVFVSLFWSFTEYNVLHAPKLVGIANYKAIFLNDPRFWKAIRNTVVYVIGVVPIGVVLSLLLAIAIDQKIRIKNFYKTIYFMPTVTSMVAISVIWKWLYAGEKYGLINYFLINLGFKPIDWLMSTAWTLPSIMIMSVWAGLGYNMVLFLAGLQSIPPSMYEAAEIDGANAWNKFRYITLPLLKPTTIFVVIMSVIASFQVFEQVYIMTGGQGEGVGGVLDCALTIVAYLYERGFQRFQMGYASALAYIIFFCIFIMTLLNIRLIKSKVEY